MERKFGLVACKNFSYGLKDGGRRSFEKGDSVIAPLLDATSVDIRNLIESGHVEFGQIKRTWIEQVKKADEIDMILERERAKIAKGATHGK